MLLNRFEKKSDHEKVRALAKQSASGSLSNFSGLFRPGTLSEKEKYEIESILIEYKTPSHEIEKDFTSLSSLTAEIKAIQNQAALLHGERISKARDILKSYREGAFSAFLKATYGNRQTPYNFLLYYEFTKQASGAIKGEIDNFPRQVIYTLASRVAAQDKKESFLEENKGKTKEELLHLLRHTFPLEKGDKRRQQPSDTIYKGLKKLLTSFHYVCDDIANEEKKEIAFLLNEFLSMCK